MRRTLNGPNLRSGLYVACGLLSGAVLGGMAMFGWLLPQLRGSEVELADARDKLAALRPEGGAKSAGEVAAELDEYGERVAELQVALAEASARGEGGGGQAGYRWGGDSSDFPDPMKARNDQEKIGRYFSAKLNGVDSPEMKQRLRALEKALLRTPPQDGGTTSISERSSWRLSNGTVVRMSEAGALGELVRAVQRDMFSLMAEDLGLTRPDRIDGLEEAYWYARNSDLFTQVTTNASRAEVHWERQETLLHHLAGELGIPEGLQREAFELMIREAMADPIFSSQGVRSEILSPRKSYPADVGKMYLTGRIGA